MRSLKSSKSVVEILHAMTESSMLKPERRQDIAKVLKIFKTSLRSRNHREVVKAVDEVARVVVQIIRSQDE